MRNLPGEGPGHPAGSVCVCLSVCLSVYDDVSNPIQFTLIYQVVNCLGNQLKVNQLETP